MRRFSQAKRRRRLIFSATSSTGRSSAAAMRSAYCCAFMGTNLGSMPRSISTASSETLGTSTLSARGAPLRS